MSKPGAPLAIRVEQARRDDRADDLRDDVGHDLARRKASAGRKADRDGRVQVTS